MVSSASVWSLIHVLRIDSRWNSCSFLYSGFISLVREEAGFLSDHPAFERHLSHLQVSCFQSQLLWWQVRCVPMMSHVLEQVGIDRIFKGAQMKNSEAMEKVLKVAVKAAVGKLLCPCSSTGLWLPLPCYDEPFFSPVDTFRRGSSNHNRIPRTTQAMTNVITGAMMKAKQVSTHVFNTGHCLAWRKPAVFFSCRCLWRRVN